MNYNSRIPNQDISALPLAEFSGRILVVDSDDQMDQAEKLLTQETILGLDTETRPAFTKGLRYDMALLQMSSSDVTVLFRLQMCRLSPGIRDILENERILKVGAALHDDVKGLQKSQGRMTVRGFIDLQKIVCHWGIEDKSVRKMAATVLGLRVSKAQRLTNWEARTLTQSQQQYAAVDAWVCRQIYIKLSETPKIL